MSFYFLLEKNRTSLNINIFVLALVDSIMMSETLHQEGVKNICCEANTRAIAFRHLRCCLPLPTAFSIPSLSLVLAIC